MITEARRVKYIETENQHFWFFTKVCLVGQTLKIPRGIRVPIYTPKDRPDFVSGTLSVGEVTALPTCTMIAPGGRVLIHNSVIDDPVLTEGALRPVGNGIHPVGTVTFEGVVDSVMHCVSPREDMKGFAGKRLRWHKVAAGASLAFQAGVIGFVVVYGGDDQLKGYTAEVGDIYSPLVDTVLAVVSTEGAINED